MMELDVILKEQPLFQIILLQGKKKIQQRQNLLKLFSPYVTAVGGTWTDYFFELGPEIVNGLSGLNSTPVSSRK